MSSSRPNSFLHGPLGLTYARTALPIIFVMGMNGLLTVVDALFLGHFVGPDALAAVTLMFPVYMLVVSLSSLVSGGMSSLVARHLGARKFAEASAVFAGAHGLALFFGAALITGYLLVGRPVALLVAGGSEELADMGLIYLRITIFFSPLLFLLAINSDALRNEGRVGFMAAMSLLVSLSNIAFNYILIGELKMGIAGSAYGTAMAQALGFVIIIGARLSGRTELHPSAIWHHGLSGAWRSILALGAPQSLNFIGIALGSAVIIAALQWVEAVNYGATVSAYGIITRIMTFAYLPMLGLSFAMQTITGNNYGAQNWQRSDNSLKLALVASLVYCVVLQFIMSAYAAPIGGWFVDDPLVISEVGRILPVIVILFFAAGPLMLVSMHFQAIGDAGRAAVLGLSKPYLFAIPLTFLLAAMQGETGIWVASPAAELMLFALTIIVLSRTSRVNALKWGLFQAARPAVQQEDRS